MEFEKKQAIYLQIGDYVLENILLKKWKEGDKIPSIRDMAVNTEVNPNTIGRTYAYLQDKGVIFNQRGIGYFIADNAYKVTLTIKKHDFMYHDVPGFFRKMDLLKFGFKDLEQLYTDYKAKRR